MFNLNLLKNNTKSGTIQVNTITVTPLDINTIDYISSNEDNYIVSVPKVECELECFLENMGEDQYMKMYLPKPIYDVYMLLLEEDPSLVDLNFNIPTKAGYYLLIGKDNEGHLSTCTLDVSEFGMEIKAGSSSPLPIDPFTGSMVVMKLDLIGGFGIDGSIKIMGITVENQLYIMMVVGEMGGDTYNIRAINSPLE